jgi:hypothetical protein
MGRRFKLWISGFSQRGGAALYVITPDDKKPLSKMSIDLLKISKK